MRHKRQVVLLAAGKSSRFYPYTEILHKTCISLLGKTIIEHMLLSIQKIGVSDVILVVGNNSVIKDIIKNNNEITLHITYVTQPEPQGMGEALLRVKSFVKEDFFLLNPYHVDLPEFAEAMIKKQTEENQLILLTRKEDVLEKFGVLRVSGEKVLEIVEKPKSGKEPSKLRVIGIYLLPKKFLDTLAQTKVGEYNLERAISEYAIHSQVQFVETMKQAVSLKYPWDLLSVSAYLFRSASSYISPHAKISKTAVIEGLVIIEEGVKISHNAIIKGPCYIGKNTFIGDNALIRDNTVISDNCVIGANTEIRGSIIFSNTKIHSGFVGYSVVGKDCRIAALFCTTNRRLDRKTISVLTAKGEVITGLTSLGAMIGDRVNIGARVTTMPGVIIGSDTKIGPTTTVLHMVEDNMTYYTTFNEVKEKRNS